MLGLPVRRRPCGNLRTRLLTHCASGWEGVRGDGGALPCSGCILLLGAFPKRGTVARAVRRAMALGPDAHSYANFKEAVVTHLHLAATVDFDARTFAGHVELTVANIGGAEAVRLDTRGLEAVRCGAVLPGVSPDRGGRFVGGRRGVGVVLGGCAGAG